jgi:hypothetical protein
MRKLKNVTLIGRNLSNKPYNSAHAIMEFEEGEDHRVFGIECFDEAISWAKYRGHDTTAFEAKLDKWVNTGVV